MESGFGRGIGRVRIEADNSAFDVLYRKRLLNRGREPHSHAVMKEHHRRKTFCLLDTWNPKQVFVKARLIGFRYDSFRLVHGLHVE